MVRVVEYYNRVQGVRTRLTGLPEWARVVLFVAALPGIALIALSILAFLVSLAALLLLTVPVYRCLKWVTGAGDVADPIDERPARRGLRWLSRLGRARRLGPARARLLRARRPPDHPAAPGLGGGLGRRRRAQLQVDVGVVAGDAIAGEASAGTLRYLLVAPAGRTRLLLAKYAAALTFCLVATLVVAASALAVGALLFPLGEVTTISGTRISFSDGLLRALLIALVVAASLIGVAALGLFVSTMTSSGIAAMATTVGLLITVQIVDQIPQLHAIHPYLFSHYWLSFADLMRDPVYWDDLVKNLGLQALYAGVFGSAAWARFGAKDIAS